MAEAGPVAQAGELTAAARARIFAAALVEMMRWRLDHGAHPDAQEMDEHFHAIVWDGIGRTMPTERRKASS